LDAALFDWDGTLANTLPIVVKSFQAVLPGVGCYVSDEFILNRIGIGDKRLFIEALRDGKVAFDDVLLSKLVREKNNLQIDAAVETPLLPGAVDLLNSVKGRIRVGLATMSSEPVIRALLEAKGLDDCFEAIVSADEVDYPKPDPEVFLKCASKLKVRPQKCVVFEDSIFGVQAAKSAGMACIAVATGAYSSDSLREVGADLLISSLKEKDVIFSFIFGHHPTTLPSRIDL
jgi:beta-phosphoglucomutase